jgi:hypothetical protein
MCHLASFANPTNTSDSLDICHSEKDDIKNDTSIKPKRQKIKEKMYKNYTYVQELTKVDPPTSNTS